MRQDGILCLAGGVAAAQRTKLPSRSWAEAQLSSEPVTQCVAAVSRSIRIDFVFDDSSSDEHSELGRYNAACSTSARTSSGHAC
jgi:hypothetical protein